MGHEIALDTPSGRVCAWRADPVAQPIGGLVVIQEIFGVNEHIRSLVERYCAEGWVALAPELFDPIEHGVELAYDDVPPRLWPMAQRSLLAHVQRIEALGLA